MPLVAYHSSVGDRCVSSAQQVIVGEELEVGLRYLQPLLLYILAGEDVGIGQHVVVYQLAYYLVREQMTVTRNDVEAVQFGTVGIVVGVLRRGDAVAKP